MAFNITSVGKYLNVLDEQERDALFPTPSDSLQVFNKRLNLVQTYNKTLGLWLDSNTRVMIIEAALTTNRFCYISGFFTVSGVQYPVTAYPNNNSNENNTQGAIIQIGEEIDVTRSYVAVATKGLYYIDYGESIAVGEYIHPKISGANSDQGFAAGSGNSTSGRCGTAYENSGANPSEPTRILVNIGLTAETF